MRGRFQRLLTDGPGLSPRWRHLGPAEEPDVVRRHMDIRDALELPEGVRVFRGHLREDAQGTYDKLSHELEPGTLPLLQADPEDADPESTALILVPTPVERTALEHKVRPWVHWLLLGLTLVTTTFAGAAHQGIDLLREPGRFTTGLPYAIALMSILGCHELAHYITARHHGIRVTPPYFIPVPFALGTFGAFIQMRSPAQNRRALFDVAVAGPLAGLVIALPALYFGLKTSTVHPVDAGMLDGMRGPMSQASILMAALIRASLGNAVHSGDALRLSPLAFAGWLGLLVTALNLIPVGQLDGGHMARALFGSRAGMAVSSAAMMLLLFLALFVWPSLMVWAIIVFFMAGRGTPPLNDVTPLSSGRKVLGTVAFILLLLILIPMPSLAMPPGQDLRWPYL